MTLKPVIRLYCTPRAWMADFTGHPAIAAKLRAVGLPCHVPTPFTEAASVDDVRAFLETRNPGAAIEVQS